MRNPNNRVPDPNSFHTSPGEKFHKLYSPRINSDGTIDLSETGRENIQDAINSHVSETDMAVIISRLQMGDTSVLTSKTPMFGDFTQFPKTYAGMLDLVNRADEAFMSLDPEIRSKYNNDKNQWFAAIGSESWLTDMGFEVSKPSVPSESSSPAVKEVNSSVE